MKISIQLLKIQIYQRYQCSRVTVIIIKDPTVSPLDDNEDLQTKFVVLSVIAGVILGACLGTYQKSSDE